MIEIRQVHPATNSKELNALTQMHLECFRAAELHLHYFARGHWWMALQDGEPIAFAGMVPSLSWSDTTYLCRSGVVEGARGNGLQKRLIKVRLAKAKKLGLNYAITDTRKNPASANSLIACGFRMYEPRKPWSFKDANYWKRELWK